MLLVVHGLPPRERTGVETHVAALARELVRQGAEVCVFAREVDRARPDRDLRRALAEGVEFAVWNDTHVARSPREALLPRGVAALFEAELRRFAPDVVHVHHLHKLGLALAELPRRRAIPSVFTAHDFFLLAEPYTLLAPDLTPLGVPGAPGTPGNIGTLGADTLARVDLARAWLDRQPGLGDHHGYALPADLTAGQRAELERLLHGDPCGEAEGPPLATREDFERLRAERADLERRRREAAAQFDLVLAPTARHARALACVRELARVELDRCGIDGAALAALAPPRGPSPGQPLRVGFVGGISKPKGLHVLLEACERLAALGRGVELVVAGDSSDHVHVSALRARAAALGATWLGAFEAAELPEVLARIDLLVVPSLWEEVAPFVIREAHAARRVVLASRTEALAESVRDGVDGLLFTQGDAHELACALDRVALEPGLFARLAAGIEAPRTLADQAAGLLARYAELAAAGTRAPLLPPSLEAFAARHAALAALGEDELMARVGAGLAQLGALLVPDAARRARAVQRGLAHSELVAHHATREAERDWLSGRVQEAETRSRVAEERAAWLAAQAGARAGAQAALEASVSTAARTAEARAREASWLRGLVRERDDALAEARAARQELERCTAWLREGLEARDEELAWRRGTLGAHERELDWRKSVQAGLERELEAVRAELATLRAETRALRAGDARQQALRADLEAECESLRALAAARDRELAEAERVLAAQRLELLALAARVEALEGERDGQLRELEEVSRELAKPRYALVARALRARARAWQLEPPPRAVERTAGPVGHTAGPLGAPRTPHFDALTGTIGPRAEEESRP